MTKCHICGTETDMPFHTCAVPVDVAQLRAELGTAAKVLALEKREAANRIAEIRKSHAITRSQLDGKVIALAAVTAERDNALAEVERIKQASDDLSERALSVALDKDALVAERDELISQGLALAQDRNELAAERDALLRNEYVCKQCGLRKDGEHATGDF